MRPSVAGAMNSTVGALQPRRNIAFSIEHTPDFGMSLALDAKNQVWIAMERPRPQAWYVELVGVTGGTDIGVLRKLCMGLLDLCDESERCLIRSFVQKIMCQLVLYVLPSQPGRD